MSSLVKVEQGVLEKIVFLARRLKGAQPDFLDGYAGLLVRFILEALPQALQQKLNNPIPIKTALARGGFIFPYADQIDRRDSFGEEIAQRLGETVLAHMCKDEERSPYRYLVSSPRTSDSSWAGFQTLASLQTFCAAYGIRIEDRIDPGHDFRLRLPESLDKFQSLQVFNVMEIHSMAHPDRAVISQRDISEEERERIEHSIALLSPQRDAKEQDLAGSMFSSDAHNEQASNCSTL